MFILVIAIRYVLNFPRTAGLMLLGKDHLRRVTKQAVVTELTVIIVVAIALQLPANLLIIVLPTVVTALVTIANIKQQRVIVPRLNHQLRLLVKTKQQPIIIVTVIIAIVFITVITVVIVPIRFVRHFALIGAFEQSCNRCNMLFSNE